MIRGTDGHLYYTDMINGSGVALGGPNQLPDKSIYMELNPKDNGNKIEI
jgi:hypothetical protein